MIFWCGLCVGCWEIFFVFFVWFCIVFWWVLLGLLCVCFLVLVLCGIDGECVLCSWVGVFWVLVVCCCCWYLWLSGCSLCSCWFGCGCLEGLCGFMEWFFLFVRFWWRWMWLVGGFCGCIISDCGICCFCGFGWVCWVLCCLKLCSKGWWVWCLLLYW